MQRHRRTRRTSAAAAAADYLKACDESVSQSQSDTTGEVLVLARLVVLPCFSPHRDSAVSCLTNGTLIATMIDARHYQLFAARPMTRLLLCACCLLLAMSSG